MSVDLPVSEDKNSGEEMDCGLEKAESEKDVGTQSINSDLEGKFQGEDTEIIRTDIKAYKYPEITVKKGVKVKWVINVQEENLNECNNEILIPKLNVDKKLVVGENIIEFTANEVGEIPYSCWMVMIKSKIIVVE